jgi:hypothetical protein
MASDKYHREGKITATRLLTCPRQVMIEDFLPTEGFDLAKASNLHWGNIAHAEVEKHSPPWLYSEVELEAEICGIQITGHLDMAASDLLWVDDLKTHSESKQRREAKKPGMDSGVRAQESIYALCIEKMKPGTKVQELRSSHLAHTSAGVPSSFKRRSLPMTEDELAAYCPAGGSSTVAELVLDYKSFKLRQEEGWDIRENIAFMPLRGVDMFRGSKCEKYCFAKEACDELARQGQG